MQNRFIPAIIIAALLISSCNNKDSEMTKTGFSWPDSVAAPVAEKKPKELTAHGDIRIDQY